VATYKRGKTYWYEFIFNGRIRESAKTRSKRVAEEAENARRRDLELGINGIRKRNFPLFSKAAGDWLDTKTGLTEASRDHYQQYVDQLTERFGRRLVSDISVEGTYPRCRQLGVRPACPPAPSTLSWACCARF
jgi:hypothetical protein